MNQNISDREILEGFKRNVGNRSCIALKGRMRMTITRADGTIEERVTENIVVKDGLNHVALMVIDDAQSTFKYLAIGTQTAQHSLGSVQGGIGEVGRKLGSLLAGSNEVAVIVATWAGQVDGLTSLDLRTGAMLNHASSGSGILLNAVNSVATILADSDFLKLQAEVQIGSHNL